MGWKERNRAFFAALRGEHAPCGNCDGRGYVVHREELQHVTCGGNGCDDCDGLGSTTHTSTPGCDACRCSGLAKPHPADAWTVPALEETVSRASATFRHVSADDLAAHLFGGE